MLYSVVSHEFRKLLGNELWSVVTDQLFWQPIIICRKHMTTCLIPSTVLFAVVEDIM